MTHSESIFPICQRIHAIVPRTLLGRKDLIKKRRLPQENLCFARPHVSLVKEKILQPRGYVPNMNVWSKQSLQLLSENKEPSALSHAASQAHNCSMDSRQQRLAVYAYMWARQANIQLKHILFIRTKELGNAWDNLRFLQRSPHVIDAWPLAQKYAFHIVCDKNDSRQELPILPEAALPVLLIRPMSWERYT